MYLLEWASVLPHSFSSLPHFLLTSRGNEGRSLLMNSLFQEPCSQSMALPHSPIKIHLPLFTHKLHSRKQFASDTTEHSSVLVCMCEHAPRSKEAVQCPALSLSTLAPGDKVSQCTWARLVTSKPQLSFCVCQIIVIVFDWDYRPV